MGGCVCVWVFVLALVGVWEWVRGDVRGRAGCECQEGGGVQKANFRGGDSGASPRPARAKVSVSLCMSLRVCVCVCVCLCVCLCVCPRAGQP